MEKIDFGQEYARIKHVFNNEMARLNERFCKLNQKFVVGQIIADHTRIMIIDQVTIGFSEWSQLYPEVTYHGICIDKAGKVFVYEPRSGEPMRISIEQHLVKRVKHPGSEALWEIEDLENMPSVYELRNGRVTFKGKDRRRKIKGIV